MNICSIGFLLSCAVFAMLFHMLNRSAQRRLFLSCVNLAFLLSLVPNRRSWVAMGAFIFGTYALLVLVKAKPSRIFFSLAIAFAVVSFAYLKRYVFLDWLLPPDLMAPIASVEVVGLSFMLFKFIHVFVDSWQGQLPLCTFYCYANYQLAFFTLLAGPIQRLNDFQQSWSSMDAGTGSTHETLAAWNRLLTGMLKMGPAALLAFNAFNEACSNLQSVHSDNRLLQFAGCFYLYPIYLYLNFSGYTDIMIGCGGLFGFKLPENFERPYIARNVLDFWNRWHITLTLWIRDYLFMTSYKAVAERFPSWSKFLGYGLLFLALLVAGVWHGTTTRFIVFGTIHGMGAATNQIIADVLKSCLGRSGFQRYQQNVPVKIVATLATFHYVCFSMLVFSSGITPTLTYLHIAGTEIVELLHFDLASILLMVLLMVFLGAICLTIFAFGPPKPVRAVAVYNFTSRLLHHEGRSLYPIVSAKTCLICCSLLVMWAMEDKDVVPVYMRF